MCPIYRALCFAGTDTTSTTLSRALQLLAHDTAIQDRLRKELIGAGGAAGIAYDTLVDAAQLPTLDAVCKETLRLYAAGPNVMRRYVSCSMLNRAFILTLSQSEVGRDTSLARAASRRRRACNGNALCS
jgi:hypothetical protein